MTTLSCSLKAQLWKRVRRKGPCHHPKKLENHRAGHLMRKKSKPWTASPKHWFPAGALSYLAGTKLLLQCGPIFSTDRRLGEFQISVPGSRVSPRHQRLTHQDDQPYFFLLPMPFLPSTHANHSSLGFPAESQVWIVWKDIWYPGAARSPSQGEAIVHSSGLSDILYARITLD